MVDWVDTGSQSGWEPKPPKPKGDEWPELKTAQEVEDEPDCETDEGDTQE